MSSEDLRFMEMAIDLARRSSSEGGGAHPLVGAVAAVGNRLLGGAFRGQKALGDHAEFTLLEKHLPRKSVIGATVYTTLEPCTTRNHPKVACAERLVERRVSRVVIGMLDPNQNICGRGVRLLRKAGIAVEFFPDHLAKQVEDQNRRFTRAQESIEARLIACGLGQKESPYEFTTFADTNTRELVLLAQNLSTLLPRPAFLPHLRRLLAAGTRVTLVLSTPEILRAIDPKAELHLRQSVQDLKRFYFSLDSPRQKSRLKVYFNPAPTALSAQIRDPENAARALLVFNPKWSTDTEPENRLYFALDRRHHKPLFDKLYGAIPGMVQADSLDLRRMCRQLGIRWAR
jgi:pyrimidine deaminase RibD-like protein